MIHDSTENSCLHLHVSCMQNIIHNRLHALMFYHLSRRWRARITVGVNRPWISCCRNGQGGGGGGGGGGGSGCSRISCCSGNGCGCGYGYGSGGNDGGSGGKFYFEYT